MITELVSFFVGTCFCELGLLTPRRFIKLQEMCNQTIRDMPRRQIFEQILYRRFREATDQDQGPLAF